MCYKRINCGWPVSSFSTCRVPLTSYYRYQGHSQPNPIVVYPQSSTQASSSAAVSAGGHWCLAMETRRLQTQRHRIGLLVCRHDMHSLWLVHWKRCSDDPLHRLHTALQLSLGVSVCNCTWTPIDNEDGGVMRPEVTRCCGGCTVVCRYRSVAWVTHFSRSSYTFIDSIP